MAKLKNQNDVFKLLTLSRQFMDEHTSTFHENERLKEGRPKEGIPSNYPRVTDKTLSKMINDTPKRVFQKLPDFTVDTGADVFTDICMEYVLNKEFIEGSDNGYSYYQKLINAGRDAAGFGVCAVYSPFELVDGSYRVGFIPIYWGDLFLEAYTTNINVSNYTFIRQWKTQADMEAILDNEDKDIDDGWDRAVVQELVDNHATTPKDANNTEQIGGSDLYEVFTYMSNDEFITFSVANGDKVMRQKDNKSKRRRIVGLYYDFDGKKPLGRSMVDIGGDLQNLIDSDMQAYQFNRALALQPPIVVSGDLDGGDGIYMPNNVLVSDEPNPVTPIVVDTTAIQNYPNLYALQKSQLNALIPNASDTTISSEATGGLSSSKTPTGIKQNQNTENITDNFFFKNAEAFLSEWAENGLNIWVNEFDGAVIELQLDNEYADKARAENPAMISDTGLVRLDTSVVTKIRVKVESGSTRDVARDEDLQRLNTLITMAGQSEVFAQTLGVAGLQAVAMSMIKQSGVTNSGEIIKAIKDNPDPQQGQGDQSKQSAPKQPSESLNYKDAPEDIKRQIEAQAGLQPSSMVSPVQASIDQKAQEAQHKSTIDSVKAIKELTAPQPTGGK